MDRISPADLDRNERIDQYLPRGRETMEQEELPQVLTDRIAALPVHQKHILALYYFEAMSCAEIGLVLDLTESRIAQIRKQVVASLKLHVRALRRD